MALQIYKPGWGTRPVRGVLFDMDGLVLDSEKLYTCFWMEAARSLGFPMTFPQALGMRSLNREAGQAKLESYFGPGVDYAQVRALRIARMDDYIAANGIALKPGIRELLAALKARDIQCAITSSSPMANIRRHLAAHDLIGAFDRLCSGYDVPNGKPAPDIYLLGAASLSLSPEDCLALEDSPTGILSAWRAGCRPVMVPDLDQPDEETCALLYARADSLSDVTGLL